jgi:hypothetical protein
VKRPKTEAEIEAERRRVELARQAVDYAHQEGVLVDVAREWAEVVGRKAAADDASAARARAGKATRRAYAATHDEVREELLKPGPSTLAEVAKVCDVKARFVYTVRDELLKELKKKGETLPAWALPRRRK